MAEQTIAFLIVTPTILVAWGLIMAYVVTLARAYNRLRSEHPAVWEALGRPSIYNSDPSVVFPARRFLWSPECQELGDPKLQSLSRWAKIFGYAGAFIFMVFVFFILWIIFYT